MNLQTYQNLKPGDLLFVYEKCKLFYTKKQENSEWLVGYQYCGFEQVNKNAIFVSHHHFPEQNNKNGYMIILIGNKFYCAYKKYLQLVLK